MKMKDKVNNYAGAAARTQVQLTISPRDPIIIRDGRPFGAGSEGANDSLTGYIHGSRR